MKPKPAYKYSSPDDNKEFFRMIVACAILSGVGLVSVMLFLLIKS